MRLKALGAALCALLIATPALAQAPITYQGTVTLPTGATALGSVPVSAANPLPVTGTISATTSATASATPTAVVAGTGKPINEGLFSNLFVSPVDSGGGDATDATNHAVKVNVVAGGATGVAQGSTTSGQAGGLIQGAVTTAAPSYTTAQTSPLSLDVHGSLRFVPMTASGVAVDLSAASGMLGADGLNIASVTNPVPVEGAAANNATAAGNPFARSCLAVSAEPTLATNGQNATCTEDLAHKTIVLPYANPENFVSGATAAMTGTTTTSLLAAPAAGLRNYVTTLVCSNSHATVGTFVNVQDGSGGTTLFTIPAGAVYNGSVITFPTPLRQPTTATALFVADVTTGANVICSAAGYKGS